MRAARLVTLCLCLAATPAGAGGMFGSGGPAPGGWGRPTLQTKVQALVTTGRKVAAAHALYAVGRSVRPATLEELTASGNLDAKDLAASDILRPGIPWRLSDAAGVRYAEAALVAKEANTPECREINRQAGPYPAPQFSCVETPDGVVFRYRL